MNKFAMRHHLVESSNIESIGHSYPRRILEIKFKNGGVYRYKGVPRTEFKKLLSAPSKGKAFYNDIKYNYPYKKYKDNDGEKVNQGYQVLLKKKPSELLDDMVILKTKEST